MTDIIYLIQFIEYDNEEDVIFQPIHCKDSKALIKCIQENFIFHMDDYQELYGISDDTFLEIKYEILTSETIKELKEVVRARAVEKGEIQFGWAIHEYNKQTIAKLFIKDIETYTSISDINIYS